MTAPVIVALLDGLDDEALDLLAERLAPRLAARVAPPARDLMTVRELAAYMRCGTARVYSLSASGQLPTIKDGSRSLFRRSEVDAWLAAGGGKRS